MTSSVSQSGSPPPGTPEAGAIPHSETTRDSTPTPATRGSRLTRRSPVPLPDRHPTVNGGLAGWIGTNRPAQARICNYCLGGNDNYAVDRDACRGILDQFPEALDAIRTSRRFGHRAVRHLARQAGIGQFLDLGCGLPAPDNLHKSAQLQRPDARTAYVDNDLVVLAHARALLAVDPGITVVEADITMSEQVLTHPNTLALLDLSEPVAALYLTLGHWLVNDTAVRRMLTAMTHTIAEGSHLVFTQLVGADHAAAQEANQSAAQHAVDWKIRTRPEVDQLLLPLPGLEPVEPGLVDLHRWRPDPTQPRLAQVDQPLRRYLGASATSSRLTAYGGVFVRRRQEHIG